jgi:tight adherence protein B
VRKKRKDFQEELPDNLDVLAGAMRTGHSTMGALSVMVDSANEPARSEFRRVLQDEQLGVPLDSALMVMARRMDSQDAEQIALVMRLQREAGGNTAEVLDRVAEVIRGRMELRRMVEVLTAQARISRWILTGLPIFVMFSLLFTGGDFLDPMLNSLVGKIALVFAAIMVVIGSFWIKQLSKLDV